MDNCVIVEKLHQNDKIMMINAAHIYRAVNSFRLKTFSI
jgi:hypothetical protein